MSSTHRLARTSAAALTLLTITAPVQAIETSIAAEAGAEYIDNARRSESQEQSDAIFTPGITVAARETSANLNLIARYNLEHRLFLEDIYDDDLVLTGYANLLWEALPERLDVRLTQQRIETTRQSFNRGTQSDLQIVSSSEFAPVLRFNVRSTDELQFEYNYVDLTSDGTDVDSQRQTGIARYVFNWASGTALSLEGQRSKTKYDEDTVVDIDTTRYLATLRTSTQNSSLRIVAGHSRLERTGQKDVEGPTGSISYTLSSPSGFALTLSGRRDIADRSQELLRFKERNLGGFIFEDTDVTDIVESEGYDIGLTGQIGANQLGLRAGYGKSDFQVLPRDNKRQSYSFRANRAVRPDIDARLSVAYEKSEYSDFAADFDEYLVEADVLWRVNSRFETQYQLYYVDRDGEEFSGTYKDFGLALTLRYYFLGKREEDPFNLRRYD